jgi:small conductance mechanosensitive channel
LLLTELKNTLDNNGLGFLISVLYIILAFASAKVLSVLLLRAYRSILARRVKAMAEDKRRRLESLGTLAVSVGRYILYFIAFAISLGELGLGNAMNSMLAAAGIGGIAIGIGAQSLIKDIMTGFFILFEDQFAVGDYVTIGEVTGTVERIELRTTVIRGYRGELNVIPNGNIGTMTNFSRSDYLAMVDIPVAQGMDTEKAMDIMLQEALALSGEDKAAIGEPEVLGVVEAKDMAAVIRLIQKVRPMQHWRVQRELTKRILSRFKREGISTAGMNVFFGGDGNKDDNLL